MENISVLERIATALERIADSLEEPAGTRGVVAFDAGVTAPLEEPEGEGVQGVEEGPVSDPLIEAFLNSRDLQIKVIPREDPSDEVINSLSEFLGKNYGGLRRLLTKIKQNMQQGNSFTLSLRNQTQRNVSDICQFSLRLHDIAFLEEYRYLKAPKYILRARPTTLPAAQSFFSGRWLERYVLIMVQKAVEAARQEIGQSLEFAYLLNPQVLLPNGDDFELDLVFHVNGVFYWIEAKSGDYQQHISKYARVSRILDLDVGHSMMVLTEITPEMSATLTSLFSMTVLSLSQLQESLLERLIDDHGGGHPKSPR